jgi:hypothetical protein
MCVRAASSFLSAVEELQDGCDAVPKPREGVVEVELAEALSELK